MKHTKHILSPLRFFLLLAVAFLFSAQFSWAVDPSTNLATYYADIDGKATDSNDALRVALCTIISSPYTATSYDNLKTQMYAASTDPTDFVNGSSKTLEDIYSSKEYVVGDAGSSATTCGTGWNKEHTVPQSWFGKATPMVSDAHHVFPTDIHMNSTRGDLPYGENNASKTCSSYGYGHSGTSTFSGYTGTVFDPGDGGANGSYKGDLARAYFYMVTRYRTTNFTSGTGNTSFIYTSGVADLTTYMKNLMLKWHREDPVSEKELKRNNAICAHQKNRNPFIDYPCLVEYIWGDRVGETVSLSSLVSAYSSSFTGEGCPCAGPTIISPATDIFVGSTSGAAITKTITVQGTNLESGNLTLSIGGTEASKFQLSTYSISKTNAEAGISVTITYTPGGTDGTHTATLNISGCGLTSTYTVNISGTRCTTYNVTLSRNGATETVSTCGTYTLPTTSEESAACSGWEFKGWSTSPIATSTTTAPSYVSTVSSATTLYAVYGQSLGGGGSTRYRYEKVTSTPSSWAGTYLIVYENGGLAFNGGLTTLDAVSNTISVTISNDTIASNSTTDAAAFTIAGTDSYTIKSASTYYIGQTSNANGLASNTSTEYANTITYNNGDVDIVSGGAYLRYNATSGQTRFRYFKSSTYSGQQAIQLYKKISVSGGGTMTYMTNPCATYTITLTNGGSATHGSFEASASSATAGTTITLDAEPDECYEYSWNVTQAGGGSVTVTNDQFSMPAANVTVSATFTALANRTAIFMNGSSTYATETGCVGKAITISDPTPCDGYTFVGWSTSQATTETTTSPTIDYTGTIPSANTTYYAVFSRTEGSGGGSGASAGTTLWAEDFSGYSANDVPSGNITNSHTGTTVYSGTLTYAVANGGGTTKVYAENNAGGTSPELLIAKSNGSFSISNLPTGSAATMTLSFNSNKTSYLNKISVTTGTSGISVGSLSYSGSVVSCTITNSGSVETFDLTIAYTDSYNSREDNFLLTVATAGSGGSTTYHTTSPSCTPTTYTITVNANAGGTASGTGTYTSGSSQSISATPNSCYRFVEWNDGNTDNPRTITVTGDATYTASFQQINYTITATTDDDAKGTVSVTTP